MVGSGSPLAPVGACEGELDLRGQKPRVKMAFWRVG